MDKKTVIALVAAGVAVVAVGISYFVTQKPESGSVAISENDPIMQNINWVKKKSKECGGDINKLSAEDKAKVISILGQPYAAKSVKMYSEAP